VARSRRPWLQVTKTSALVSTGAPTSVAKTPFSSCRAPSTPTKALIVSALVDALSALLNLGMSSAVPPLALVKVSASEVRSGWR
jgi:hypothetical protein